MIRWKARIGGEAVELEARKEKRIDKAENRTLKWCVRRSGALGMGELQGFGRIHAAEIDAMSKPNLKPTTRRWERNYGAREDNGLPRGHEKTILPSPRNNWRRSRLQTWKGFFGHFKNGNLWVIVLLCFLIFVCTLSDHDNGPYDILHVI